MPFKEHAKISLSSAVLSLAALLVCSVVQAAEPKLVVTTEPKSQPESFSEGPDDSLFIGSASKPVIYRAAKGQSEAKIFIDVPPRAMSVFSVS